MRRGNVRRRERRRGHLVKQRLEEMVVGPVDHRHPDRRPPEFFGHLEPAETGPNDDDLRFSLVLLHSATVPATGGDASDFPREGHLPQLLFVRGDKCAILRALMPKSIARSKTRKAVAKRFKITATGKVLRSQASRRHLMSAKNAKRKRQLSKTVLVHETDVQRIKANLPFA